LLALPSPHIAVSTATYLGFEPESTSPTFGKLVLRRIPGESSPEKKDDGELETSFAEAF
jgi:hypothetical protein